MTDEVTDTSVLSTREQQIAEDYAKGESYQQIADRLCLAPSTVRTHLATIYRKLGVSSKLDLRDRLGAAQPARVAPESGDPIRPEKPSIAVLAFAVENQPHSPFAQFRAKLVRGLAHDAPSYSGVGASCKPGVVQDALQAMKDWHKLKLELFKKQPYYLPGCDR